MPHLTKQDRCKIENLLNVKVSIKKIGKDLQKSHTTISREIKKRRIVDEASKQPRKNFCTLKKHCMKRTLCKVPPSTCQNRCSTCRYFSCNEICSVFIEDHCDRLSKSPYVCNGCADLKKCKKRKYFYCANNAMDEYKSVLVQSRQGIDVSPTEIKMYNNLIKAGVRKGQSIHHVMAGHKDVFQKCEKSIYNYFNCGYFSLARGDMPKICMRKPRKREKITHKIDSKCRQNRTLADYKKFKIENPDIAEVQMDSVIGTVGGKVLLTLQFEFGLMLAQLRDTNNSQSVIDYFDMLEQKFGLNNFRKIFPVILTDNGSEFSNPGAIEISPFSKQQRTRVFYCDPYSSWQKGKVENNHTNLRRILPKRTSFNNLNQNDIDLVLSHLNSYMRKRYDDIPAITRFNNIFDENILEQLNINLIDPNDVILDPKLLKGKI
jgi:IS30 family transposase